MKIGWNLNGKHELCDEQLDHPGKGREEVIDGTWWISIIKPKKNDTERSFLISHACESIMIIFNFFFGNKILARWDRAWTHCYMELLQIPEFLAHINLTAVQFFCVYSKNGYMEG